MKLIIVLLFTFVAAVCDLKSRKIPNKLIALMLVVASAWHLYEDSLLTLMWSWMFFIAIVVLLLLPFAYRLIGGGDVKLIGAIAAYTNINEFLHISIYFSLIGGLYALYVVLKRKVMHIENNDIAIPYAVPIFLGVLAYVCLGGMTYV